MTSNYKAKTTKEQREEAVKDYLDETKEITLQQLAERHGVSHQAVAKWVKVFMKRQENIMN